MNTQKIKMLLAAIDEGSYTKAGNKYGYTQSGLTNMMRSFEEELGFPLLIKTSKGVEPTGETKLLLPAMRDILRNEERLMQEIDEIRGIKKGTIRIGSLISTSVRWLPQILDYFRENYPDIKFNIEELGHGDLIKGLNEGTLDIALMSNPEVEDIDCIPITEDPLMAVFSSRYDLGKYDAVPVDALKDMPLIMEYHSYDRDSHRVFEEAGIEPDVHYYSKDDFAIVSMVQKGLGVTILPEMIVEEFPGDYDYRMLDPERYRTLGVAIKSLADAGPLAKFVIKYIKENIR